jgi:hypothetical protein
MDLQEEIEKYCATKVELMAFREETAINFGKVHAAIIATHVEIAKGHDDLNSKIAASHNDLNSKIAASHNDLSSKIAASHNDLSSKIAASHNDLSSKIADAHVEIAKMETRIIKWFVGTAITLTGVVFAMARYLP